jgi:hypothetical protein
MGTFSWADEVHRACTRAWQRTHLSYARRDDGTDSDSGDVCYSSGVYFGVEVRYSMDNVGGGTIFRFLSSQPKQSAQSG